MQSKQWLSVEHDIKKIILQQAARLLYAGAIKEEIDKHNSNRFKL